MEPVYVAFSNIVVFKAERPTIHGNLLDCDYHCEPGVRSLPSKLDFCECHLGTTYPRMSGIYFAAGSWSRRYGPGDWLLGITYPLVGWHLLRWSLSSIVVFNAEWPTIHGDLFGCGYVQANAPHSN